MGYELEYNMTHMVIIAQPHYDYHIRLDQWCEENCTKNYLLAGTDGSININYESHIRLRYLFESKEDAMSFYNLFSPNSWSGKIGCMVVTAPSIYIPTVSMRNWCKENCIAEWECGGGGYQESKNSNERDLLYSRYLFELEDDAMAFKLAWS